MKRYLVAILVMVFACAVARPKEIGSPLKLVRTGHPRLLLTDEALATALAEAKKDPLRAALHERIVATAESVLNAPSARKIPAGNLSLDQERYAVFYILHCAMAYRLTHDERFLARAKAELLNVANFEDWNPDHFLDVGELSFAVAIGYDWLFPQLQPAERQLLKQALMTKSLALADVTYAAKEKKGRRMEWAVKGSNWNQVCNSGVLCAALVLADEEPQLVERIVSGVRSSLPIGMAPYAPDGEYPEGPGYWTFGTTYNVIGLAALEGILGMDFGLAKASGFDRTIDYVEAIHGPFGVPFNYADSTDDPQNSPARSWLAQRYHRPIALRNTRSLLAATLAAEKITPFDPAIQIQVVNRFFPLHASWFSPENAEAGEALPLDQHFRGVADLAVFRSEWNNPRALFVGLKAGENSSHHNHLDLGSFVLDADGVRWALDLGPDVYELPGYFDYKAKRWDYFRVNNHSHNTITLGEALQKTKTVAPIVTFGSTRERGFAIADLTAAYPDQAASLRRGIALLDRARVLVQDEFTPLRAETPLCWRMVTRAKIDFERDGRVAVLKDQGRVLRAEILEPTRARFSSTPATPRTSIESQNAGASILTITFAVSSEAPLRLAVLLTPVGEKWPRLATPGLKFLNEWTDAASK
ncbi:MAG: heparinase II/III family protein [Nibricoccus sp.]